jgi:hypothetical protein
MHSHYKPVATAKTVARLLRVCTLLDDNPALWIVYAEMIRDGIGALGETLERRREAMDRLRGGLRSPVTGEMRTARAKQMADRRHCWDTRPHVCQECGLELTWPTAKVHHIQEVQDGGPSTDDNMQLLCLNCEAHKHRLPCPT